jgi:hypothetical protein
MSHPDDCPKCGQQVPASGAYSVGSGFPMADPRQQAETCTNPDCGAKLRRAIGEPWREATGPGSDAS